MNKVLLMRRMLIGVALVGLMVAAIVVRARGSVGSGSLESDSVERIILTTFTYIPNTTRTMTPTPIPETTSEATVEAVAEVVLMGDPVEGEALFKTSIEGAPQCSACHLTSRDAFAFHSVGPNLDGVATRAETRIEGLTAEEYLRQSILDPSIFVVDTFSNVMYPNYANYLSETDVNNLIAFLLTLAETEPST